METQTSKELLAVWLDRLKELEELVLGANLSRLKERRQFATVPFPFGLGNEERFPNGDGEGWNSTLTLGFIVDPIATLLRRDLTYCHQQLAVHPSEKVRYLGRPCSILEGLRRAIGRLEVDGRMGTLAELFLRYGRQDEYLVATGPGGILEQPFVKDLLGLLSQVTVSREDWLLYRRMWPISVFADLREKLYPHRGEIRAFVADKDVLRSLLGSILHKLLLPSEDRAAEFEPYSDVFPRSGKHILSESWSISSVNELTLIFGDISSFTASKRNIWIALIATIQFLEEYGLNDVLVIDVRGSLLETTLVEALRCYLYLASAVEVRDEQDSFFSVGAMLGIAGVDTLAKAVFALFLRGLCLTVPGAVGVYPRVGGDDFIIRLITSRRDPVSRVRIVNHLRQEISKYIGHVKEFSELRLPIANFDIVTEDRYCKKLLRIVGEEQDGGMTQFIRLQSQFSLPLFKDLIQPTEHLDPMEFDQFWDATRAVPWVPENEYLRNLMFALHSGGSSGPLSTTIWSRTYDGIVEDLDGFTPEALRAISQQVRPVRDSQGELYRVHPRSMVSSMRPERLRRIKVGYGRSARFIVALTSEPLPGRGTVPIQLPDRTIEVPDDILEAVRRAQEVCQGICVS